MKAGKTLKDFPNILKQWDYEKNGDIDPLNVPARRNKKYWWKCPKCNQSYLASPDKKTYRKFGCPVCSNYLVIKGINDFESNFPVLMKDWDFSKNTDIDPTSLSKRSLTKVNWKCHICSFEWNGTIRTATKKNINCPKCSKKDMSYKRHLFELEKNGCFKDENLLKDWDFEKNTVLPSEVTPRANIYIHWKCHKCGYEWKAKLSNRTNGRGCPCCSNKVVVPGVNDLATTHPSFVKEWHPTKNGNLKPSDVTYGMSKPIWWICPNGHEYRATLLHRTVGIGTNCPICNSGRQTSFREQALYYYVKKMYPDAINRYKPESFGKFELDIYIPSFHYGIEYDGVAWHKKENFERERRKYQMCKEHGITLLRVKEKMPDELGLELADTIISSDDFETEEGLTKVIHMILEHIDWSDMYWLKPMDVNLSRDRFEIMKYAAIAKDSIAEKFPEKAKDWHPTKNGTLKPTMFKPGSDFKIWWLCPDCGYEYEQTVNNHIHGGGCPKCVSKYSHITRRMNLIKEKGSISDPILLEDWNYEKNDKGPDSFTNGSDEKVWWKCHKCGHEWRERIANRHHGRGCPKCANRKLIVGHNDFATKHPELLNEWLYEKNTDIDPQHIHYKSVTPVWWKCPICGYEYQAPPIRRSLGNGCRKCADKANGIHHRELAILKNGSIAQRMPELVKEYCEDNVLPPDKVSSSSHDKVHWKCSVCGHDWWTQPYVRLKGSGCPECGKIKSAQTRKGIKRKHKQ